jgi:hypothetical protein
MEDVTIILMIDTLVYAGRDSILKKILARSGAGAAFLAAGWAGGGVFGMQAAGGLALGAAGSVAGGAIGGAIDPVHGAA